MSGERLRIVAAAGLVIGALLGMAGTFAPSAELRGLAWGVDGTALIVGVALLAVHHLRQGNEQLAAGFLVFLAGETLIVSGSAMELAASAPTVAAGFGLWAAALALARQGDWSNCSDPARCPGGSDVRRCGTDTAVQATAVLCVSIPGDHVVRMGLGAREIESEPAWRRLAFRSRYRPCRARRNAAEQHQRHRERHDHPAIVMHLDERPHQRHSDRAADLAAGIQDSRCYTGHPARRRRQHASRHRGCDVA
jgi:hypothetical protein